MSRMLLLLSFAASAGLSANAHANHWSVCNRTPEDLNVAIAYQDTQNQTIIEGWHQLPACHGCAVVLNYDKTEQDTVYLYGENSAHVGRFEAEHPRLCVEQSAFRQRNVPNTTNCPGPGGKTVGFQKVTLPDWNKNYTTNLTAGSGKPGCIE